MIGKLVSAAVLSAVVGLTLASSEAQARRKHFWWQDMPINDGGNYDGSNDPLYDPYATDEQDAYAQDLFNQQQYDLYMREMNHRRRQQIYDQSYYDPQYDGQADGSIEQPPSKKRLPKIKNSALMVPKTIVAPDKPMLPKALSTNTKIIVPAPSKPLSAVKPAAVAAINCNKGAAIVSSYGFETVTNKTCDGKTYIYGAVRSGKNFEIQVSAANGELTSVKKL